MNRTDWNDTSRPEVREQERQERLDYELEGCDTEETLLEDDELDDADRQRELDNFAANEFSKSVANRKLSPLLRRA